jgi:hypothetical protein
VRLPLFPDPNIIHLTPQVLLTRFPKKNRAASAVEEPPGRLTEIQPGERRQKGRTRHAKEVVVHHVFSLVRG